MGRTARRTAVTARRTATARVRLALLPALALALRRGRARGLWAGRNRRFLRLDGARLPAPVPALGGRLLPLLPDLRGRRPRLGLARAPRGRFAVGPAAGQQVADREQPEHLDQ